MNTVYVELIPVDGRKSFYGKAKIYKEGNEVFLVSYNTVVCKYNVKTGKFTRIWDGYSATTMRHISAFISNINGMGGIGKKWWNEQAIGQPNSL